MYELSPSGAGWTKTDLYSFTGNGDGGIPQSGVVLDANGNLYGTTEAAGAPMARESSTNSRAESQAVAEVG